MPVLCQNEWHVITLFGALSMGIVLVFSSPFIVTEFKETPQRGVKYNTVRKFGKCRHLSRKWYEIGL